MDATRYRLLNRVVCLSLSRRFYFGSDLSFVACGLPIDNVTMEVNYYLPSSAYQKLKFTLSLPGPIQRVDNFALTRNISTTVSATSPPQYQLKLGPTDTAYPYNGKAPYLTVTPASNSLSLDYGDYFNYTSAPYNYIDFLMTTYITPYPWPNRYLFATYVQVTEYSGSQVQTNDRLVGLYILQPVLEIEVDITAITDIFGVPTLFAEAGSLITITTTITNTGESQAYNV